MISSIVRYLRIAAFKRSAKQRLINYYIDKIINLETLTDVESERLHNLLKERKAFYDSLNKN